MRQLKPLSTALLAIFALATLTATLAQAAATLPNILPEASANPITGTIKSGESRFGPGLISTISKEGKGTFRLNALKLGSFRILFVETTNSVLSGSCNGLGLSSGEIEVVGTFHIRDYKEGALKTAMIFLLAPVHFECAGAVLAIVLGCVAGQLTPENLLTKTLSVNLTGAGNDNVPITVLKEELNGEEACQLLASENDAATYKLAKLLSVLLFEKPIQSGNAITVLVMPL